MALSELGGTPSELQAKILEGLLSSSRRITGAQPASQDLPIKDVLPSMLAALNLADKETKFNVLGQNLAPLTGWWEIHKQTGIAIRLAHSEKDENPNFVMLTATLLSDLMAVSLGGMPNSAQSDRLPSRMELNFAKLLGPPLANAINPLLRNKIFHFSAMRASAKEALEMITEQTVHLIDLKLEWENKVYSVSMALAEKKIERRVAKHDKPNEPGQSTAAVAAEIGKTSICVDVLFKLADQTLQRLQNLKEGDVLAMMPNSLTAARMQVRGHDIYIGQIGHLGKSFGFNVSHTAQNRASGLTNMVKSLTGVGEES
jgi:flagellar motor switch protein FliM